MSNDKFTELESGDYPHYKRFEWQGYVVEINYDESAGDPREDMDLLGTWYVPHPPRGCDWSSNNANEEDAENAPVKLPLYALDHSLVTVRSTPFGVSWDSWCAGCLYVTAETMKKEYGDDPEAMEHALSCLEGEIELFDDWLNSRVYYFVLRDKDGKELDSVGGYYGESAVDEILSECLYAIEYYVEQELPLFSGTKFIEDGGVR